MLAGIAAGCVQQTDGLRPDSDLVVVSVLGSNDLHGQFGVAEGRGGLTTFSGYVAALREVRSRDGGVLLVDAGDMWQGSLASNLNEGALMVEAFNALGYEAAAIGNHEFDFGPAGPATIPGSPADDPRGNLKQRAAQAGFPLLAANLIDEETGARVDWPNVRSSAMVDVAGVPVGIVGVLTRSTLMTTIPANVGGLEIAPLTATIIREARKLREAGAALVVVTAHAGGRCTAYGDPRDLSSCDPESEILAVAAGLPPGLVDQIIGGHEAHAIAHFVNGIAVTAGLSYGRAFSRTDFWVDRTSGAVRGILLHRPQAVCPYLSTTGGCAYDIAAEPGVARATYEGRPVTPDPAVEAIAARAARHAADLENESLGVTLATPFTLEGNPDSALGHLVTDVLLASLEADVVLFNVDGGLRSALPAGPLTYGSLYRMFPFDNRVVILEMTGSDLKKVIAAQLRQQYRVLGLAGLQVSASCTDGRLHVSLRLDDGRILADEDRVPVAVNDFLALGGADILTPVMPAGGFAYADDPRLVRDLIADWFRGRGGTLDAADFGAPSPQRWVLSAELPGDCRRQALP